ncbi:hypothetical protein BC827DRAFT_324262 [Russula dissimulans]|jgi:hypothetical protein|nr:hypothetical protein BC827DRAFT_324262 [Russula dissimulans]
MNMAGPLAAFDLRMTLQKVCVMIMSWGILDIFTVRKKHSNAMSVHTRTSDVCFPATGTEQISTVTEATEDMVLANSLGQASQFWSHMIASEAPWTAYDEPRPAASLRPLTMIVSQRRPWRIQEVLHSQDMVVQTTRRYKGEPWHARVERCDRANQIILL